MGKLRNLTFLYLSRNQLSGEIPAELEQLSNLVFVNVDNNSLSGCLPSNWLVYGRLLPVCSAASGRISQQQADQEFRALAALFEDAGGPEWDREVREHWLSDKPLGEWAGVETDDNGYVVGLILRQEFKGTLPAELGDLTYLRTLSLVNQGASFLTGGIPKELGNLSHLTRLTLMRLYEAGNIPSELSNLKALDLSENQLTGEIPAELGTMSNLIQLRLAHNKLSGTVPRELGNLTELQYLDLSGNDQLTGEIPQEVWDLPKLNRLGLAGSHEYGCVPAELKDRLYSLYSTYVHLRFC